MTTASLAVLTSNLVDYAGLFPPASLSIRDTASNYAAYRAAPHSSMLGTLIVPAARLGELAATPIEHARISALLSDDREVSARTIAEFNEAHSGRLRVASVEAQITSPADAERIARLFGAELGVFLEFPVAETSDFVPRLKEAGARAKLRTGGVTPDAIPSSDAIAGFIVACAGEVPFKATAGLHHPIRSSHPLTYESGAVCGTMHGFLNVFVAATFACAGGTASQLVSILDDDDATAFRFTDHALSWRGETASIDEVRRCRNEFALSFGSCSFQEPVDDLTRLGLL